MNKIRNWGMDKREALRLAADHTARTMELTRSNPARRWFGVEFEKTLPDLLAPRDDAERTAG